MGYKRGSDRFEDQQLEVLDIVEQQLDEARVLDDVGGLAKLDEPQEGFPEEVTLL